MKQKLTKPKLTSEESKRITEELLKNFKKSKRKPKFKSGYKGPEDGFATEKQIDSDTGIRISYSSSLHTVYVSLYKYKNQGTMWDPKGWRVVADYKIDTTYLDEMIPFFNKIVKTNCLK